MPGKVNPSIAEMVNQVCYQVMGLDTTVALAAEAGQLELNVMMPVITHNILFAMHHPGERDRGLRRALHRRDRGRRGAVRATGWSGARRWSPRWPRSIGYAEAAKLAKEAVESGLTVKELVIQKGVLKGRN